MIAFEEKIIRFQKENDEVQNFIVKGSDEHLDLLLSIKTQLDQLTDKFIILMSEIIPGAGKLSSEELNKSMPSLLDLYSSSIKLVAALKRSATANDIKSSSQRYYSEVENLREFIYDLENIRLSDDKDLENLLDGLNKL